MTEAQAVGEGALAPLPHQTEEWTYLGERPGTKWSEAWRGPDGDVMRFGGDRKGRAQMADGSTIRPGAVCRVSVRRGEGGNLTLTTRGERVPVFLRMADDAAEIALNAATEAARAGAAKAAEKAQREGSGFGTLTLEEVRAGVRSRFGPNRTAFLAAVLDFLTR